MNSEQEPIIDPIELSMGQKFEIERMNRVIDSTSDVEALRSLSKQLVSTWMAQKATTDWMIRQNLKHLPQIATLDHREEPD